MVQMFARITGFGLSVAPVWPCRVERVADDPAALAVTAGAGEAVRAVVVRGGREVPVADLGEGVASIDEVVEVRRGPDTPEWRIETLEYSISWPAGFALESSVDDNESTFDLHGPGGVLIWLRGPFERVHLPAVDALAAPGQTLTGVYSEGGMEAAELAYEHGGATWNQRHYLVQLADSQVVVVSAQAPVEHGELYRRASAEVATSLQPTPLTA